MKIPLLVANVSLNRSWPATPVLEGSRPSPCPRQSAETRSPETSESRGAPKTLRVRPSSARYRPKPLLARAFPVAANDGRSIAVSRVRISARFPRTTNGRAGHDDASSRQTDGTWRRNARNGRTVRYRYHVFFDRDGLDSRDFGFLDVSP